MTKPSGNIRMGTVSFITLVSVILLAILSVLCVTTASASRATAERQAWSTSSLYEVDAAGQRALAAIDGYLAQSQQGGEKPSEAVTRIVADGAGTFAATANEGQTATVAASSTASDELDLTTTADGHELDAKLRVNADLSYTILAWKSSPTPEESGDATGLWGGASSQGTVDAAASGAGSNAGSGSSASANKNGN